MDNVESVALTRWQCIKNLLAISFSFFFLFCAYGSFANLQSSLNSEASLGTVSLFVIYAAYALSCLFLSSIVIAKFGFKWTIVISEITYCFYFIANLYSKWWTLIPSGLILGIGAGPLWCTQGVLITELANEYLSHTTDNIESVLNRFFGIFLIICQSYQIIGSLVSSLVLKRKVIVSEIQSNSSSLFNITKDFSNCGINDCPQVKSGESIIPPEMKTVYLLCGIYIACGIVAVLIIVFFLDNIKGKSSEDQSTKERLLETIMMFKDWRVWALLPLNSLGPLFLVFVSTDISKAFVSCMLGIEYVGYWFIGYGLTSAVFSLVAGYLVKHIGRMPLILGAMVLSAGLHVFILLWKFNNQQSAILYSLSIFYGMSDSVYQTQLNSLVGVLFADSSRAAYSANRLCIAIAGTVGYAYSSYLCVKTKCYILLATVGFSLLCYIFLEAKIRKEFKYSKVKQNK